jgi:hypothetical protein
MLPRARTLRRTTPALAAVAAVALAAAPVQAASTKKLLWATVNICDTVAHPNQMGVRGSMPGTGRSGKMFIRFTAEFFDVGHNSWTNVKGTDTSPWVFAGSSKLRHRQAGYTFKFDAPNPPGSTFLLRSTADFKWTERHRVSKHSKKFHTVVIKRRRAITTTGHPDTLGADPKDYSNGACEIS